MGCWLTQGGTLKQKAKPDLPEDTRARREDTRKKIKAHDFQNWITKCSGWS